MSAKQRSRLDYSDPDIREEILVRQRRDMWTPEQIASLTGHFRLAPGMSLLDAGCGLGYLLRTFGRYCMPGGRLVGVDREPELLDTAARLALQDGLEDSATFETGDIYGLDFPEGTFDVAMAQVVLCHLDDPQRALDELIRVTKPGGCIAILDNAVTGCNWGWSNVSRPTTKQAIDRCAVWLHALRGRRKLGRGDWSLGAYVPSWMEARGLDDVDARVNERVTWMAPPYRSPAQQTTLEAARARSREDGFDDMNLRNLEDELHAAGADAQTIRRAVRAEKRRSKRFREALADNAAAFTYGGTFWCAWGFKP